MLNDKKALMERLDTERFAMISAEAIVESAIDSSTVMNDVEKNKINPILIMFPFLSFLFGKDTTYKVLIDGASGSFNIYALDTEKEIEVYDTETIAKFKPLNPQNLPERQRALLKTYYLLRHYLFGGSYCFCIEKLDEGFVVYVNDSTKPSVWAAHKVN